jgi:hypothetical protein
MDLNNNSETRTISEDMFHQQGLLLKELQQQIRDLQATHESAMRQMNEIIDHLSAKRKGKK